MINPMPCGPELPPDQPLWVTPLLPETLPERVIEAMARAIYSLTLVRVPVYGHEQCWLALHKIKQDWYLSMARAAYAALRKELSK